MKNKKIFSKDYTYSLFDAFGSISIDFIVSQESSTTLLTEALQDYESKYAVSEDISWSVVLDL